MSLVCCSCVEREKACPDTAALVGVVRGSVPGGGNREGLSTVAGCADGLTRSSCEAPAGHGGVEPRGQVICGSFVRSTGCRRNVLRADDLMPWQRVLAPVTGVGRHRPLRPPPHGSLPAGADAGKIPVAMRWACPYMPLRTVINRGAAIW